MAEVDLNCVEAGLQQQGRSCSEIAHDPLDVRWAGFARPLHGERAENRRRSDPAESGGCGNGACVPDLSRDGSPLGVYRVGQLAKAGQCGFGQNEFVGCSGTLG